MNDDDKEKLQIIKGAVKIFDKAVSIFCENIDKPVWVMDNGNIFPRYKSPTSLARFRTSGMPDTPRVDEMIRAVASSVHRALNTFVLIADGISRIDLRRELIDKRNEFQKSKAYKKQ